MPPLTLPCRVSQSLMPHIFTTYNILPHCRSFSTLVPPPESSLHQSPLPAEAEGEDDESLTVPVADRTYWTKCIHALCAERGDPDGALRLLDRLRLRGYLPDSRNLSSVIHALCDAGRSGEAHRRLLLLLSVSSSSTAWLPDDRTANVLIARLLDARTPQLTLRVVRRLLAAKHSFVPTLINYNRLVHLFCVSGKLGMGHEVFVEMKMRGRAPDTISYTTLIDGFARMGELKAAHQLLGEMIKVAIRPNALTYSSLIKGVLRERNLCEARALMDQLWASKKEDDVAEEEDEQANNNAAFANLIDALCREGFYHEVFRIAEEMPQQGFVADEFVYGQMIDSLCRAGRHHGASRIVYILRKRGFLPSMVSYNCIVHNLCKTAGGGYLRAYQLFCEGRGFGYQPPMLTYKALVDALCRERDLDKAKDVTGFMLQNVRGDDKLRIYNVFLSALRQADNPTEQLNVLVSMLQNQCQPDVVTLNTVIHGFCKVGKINEALKILNDMLDGKFSPPDAVTFTTVISGLLHAGRTGEALQILSHKMPGCGCRPTIVTYNAVLRGLCNLQEVDRAMDIFNRMVAEGISADSTTFAVLINGLWESGRIVEAKKFWDDVIWPSKVHDDFVYAAIFRGLCNLDKLNDACHFMCELVDCGVSLGIVNYNILIDSACKKGLKKEAYWIVSEMRKNGMKPDAVTWRILSKLHKNDRNPSSLNAHSEAAKHIDYSDEQCYQNCIPT